MTGGFITNGHFKARGNIHVLRVLGQKYFTQLPPSDLSPFYLAVHTPKLCGITKWAPRRSW